MPVQANRLGAQSCRTRCLQQLGNRQLLVDQVVVVDELCDRKLEAMMAGNDLFIAGPGCAVPPARLRCTSPICTPATCEQPGCNLSGAAFNVSARYVLVRKRTSKPSATCFWASPPVPSIPPQPDTNTAQVQYPRETGPVTRITLARRAKIGPATSFPGPGGVGTGLFQGHYEFAPISLFWPSPNCGCRQAYLPPASSGSPTLQRPGFAA
jgi:hypothetical protein